jgi:hypoxanthine phosphoribosyltransferase
MQETVTLGDKRFQLYIAEKQILAAIEQMAQKINADYQDKTPLIIPILNGSFLFAADLVRLMKGHCEISFIKASSYKGDQSTGQLISLIGVNEEIKGRDVLILEDIIDTGHTLSKILPAMQALQPASLRVATLLFKPNALQTKIPIDYVGIEIPNEFIVGYGLDYDGLGRNLKDIYQVI